MKRENIHKNRPTFLQFSRGKRPEIVWNYQYDDMWANEPGTVIRHASLIRN